jgi:hypothetical protein
MDDDSYYDECVAAMVTAGQAYADAGGRDEDELERAMTSACKCCVTMSMLIEALAQLHLTWRFGQ